MRKTLSLILVLIMILALNACSSEAKDKAAFEEIKEKIEETFSVKETDSYCEVTGDKTGIIISYAPKGIGNAYSFHSTTIELNIYDDTILGFWDDIRCQVIGCYYEMKEIVESHGIEDREFVLNIIDDTNHDFIIFSVVDGEIVSDATDEWDSNYFLQAVETPEPTVNPAYEPTAEPQPSPTIGERNALGKAREYLNLMAFSYTGLIEQLEFEQFTHDEAVYAADNCGADWNDQAAKKAKDYLNIMSFSRDGLIEQLEFEGFTHDQAVYGVEANGY